MNSPSLRDEAAVVHLSRGSVCVVTVTYANREHLVRQVLVALLKEREIWKILVVRNGCAWDVQGLAEELGPDRIEVLDLKSNRGSAAGFAAGIKRACDLDTDFIWLLDDDNEPQSGALAELLAAYTRLTDNYPVDRLAVLAFRPDHQADIAAGVPQWCRRRRPSSFWGFHIFDIPYKLWRRTPWGRPRPRGALPSAVEMTEGPYGGLLFQQALVKKHGLPREDFILYADDTEFTSRITSNGGAIWLVTSATLVDLEVSWRVHRHYAGSFHAWLNLGSDLRAFYSARNESYRDSHCFPHNRTVYWINRRVYCFALWLLALIFRRSARYRLLQTAIRDGLDGHLGVRSEYPL